MKALIFLSALLLLSISAYAEEPLSFSDSDLKKYNSSGQTVVPENLKHQVYPGESPAEKAAKAKAEKAAKRQEEQDKANRDAKEGSEKMQRANERLIDAVQRMR